jgi:arylsulfatase A-like enzyme
VSEAEPPNVVVIVSDDQGYGDLSCVDDAEVRTPSLDALAASGVRFTSFYANSPVCSPSRASLLNPARAGVREILASLDETPGLPPDATTLAAALRSRGYRTALVGKWHLGWAAGSRPDDHGFDEWFGLLGGAHDYYSHLIWGAVNREIVVNGRRGLGFLRHDLWENGEEAWRDGVYSTELFGERAVEFVRSAARAGPFFLYLGFTAPHHPMHAPERYKERFPDLPPDRRIMAAMLSAMDDQIGLLLDELERQGVRDDTIVVFLSDNGPSRQSRNRLDGTLDPYYGGSTGSLRGHKFSLFEGGIRVPAILSWPARVNAGRVVDEVAVGMDVFPTVGAAAGLDVDALDFDGRDLTGLLAGGPTPHDAVLWEFGVQTAVRRGDWKLVLDGLLIPDEPQPDPVHLSNVRDDPGETTNLAEEAPELTAELRELVEAWRAELEDAWERDHAPRYVGENTYAVTDTAGIAVYGDPRNAASAET